MLWLYNGDNNDLIKTDAFMQMPTAWLSLFDQVFILALIPLMNGVVYPTLDKIGVSVSLLTRIGKSF